MGSRLHVNQDESRKAHITIRFYTIDLRPLFSCSIFFIASRTQNLCAVRISRARVASEASLHNALHSIVEQWNEKRAPRADVIQRVRGSIPPVRIDERRALDVIQRVRGSIPRVLLVFIYSPSPNGARKAKCPFWSNGFAPRAGTSALPLHPQFWNPGYATVYEYTYIRRT